jgi:FAD:protein FMN transferase
VNRTVWSLTTAVLGTATTWAVSTRASEPPGREGANARSTQAGVEGLDRFEFARPRMGTLVRLVFYCRGEGVANEAARAAYARVDELNAILSDYEPESELNRLARSSGPGTPIEVSEPLFTVLAAARTVSRVSDGAFDVTVGPLTKLWRTARRKKSLPDAEDLAAARRLVGWKDVVLDEEARTVELRRAGARLDLGGIAKGYVADEMLRVLRKQGIERAMVDAGGDLVLGDAPPGEKGWKVVVAPLSDRNPASSEQPSFSRTLVLANRGVATSGDLYQFLEIDGRRYSHIVDPRTGLGLTERSSVTVVAPDGTTADAYASAISVLGPERGTALAERTKGVRALIVFEEDGATRCRGALE